ncbi:PIN domain-containing protein [Algoriphagus aestuarii]|nr:PIN domain-containing protein [Algoriphagus aestuarii]
MRKVLVDTTVWIEFLKGNPDFFQPMTEIMENGEIYTLELIFAELLQGVKNNRERTLINDFYQQMRVLDSPGMIVKAGEFAGINKLLGRGIGLIDAVIIYAAMHFGLELWTLDRKIIGFMKDLPST